MDEAAGGVDWRTNGVRIVKGSQLDLNTPQTPGMTRAAAINHARAGANKLWAGTVSIEPNAKTGAHHHGHLESIIYVVRGRARMRWGERLEFVAEADPGDFIFVPPYVPHQEINAGTERAARVRAGAQRPGGGRRQSRHRARREGRDRRLGRPQPPRPGERTRVTRLDIHSDVVCPWCYLGAANLLKALSARAGPHPFAIRWHPFQLDPTIPPEGLDRAVYMRAKFGDGDRIAAAHARLEALGRDAGLDFHFDRITRSPNTLDAHRVIRWAEPEGLQTRTAMILFRRYFELGEDISDPEVLAAAAGEAGLDAPAIARLLAGDTDRDSVRAEARAAAEMGIDGVPAFIVAGRYAVSGAQPPEVWTRLADEIDAATPEP